MLSNVVKMIGLNKRFIQLLCVGVVVVTTTLCYLFLHALINIFVPHQPKSTQIKPFSDSNRPSKVWPGHPDTLLKNESTVYYPWANDTQCKNFAVRLAKNNTFQPRALVSYPGSGNSWLRHLIDCSTGIFTGSVYGDPYVSKKNLLGELRPPNEGSTIVQKTHHEKDTNDTSSLFSCKILQADKIAKLSEDLFGYRGILLIRNPYDAILSYWNFLHTGDHLKYGQQFNSSDSKWIKFIEINAELWYNLIMKWVVNSKDLLIVLYEDLKMNPRKELLRIHKYLKQPVNTKRLDCLLKKEHLEGRFHRPHHISKNKSQQRGNSTPSIETQDPFTRKSIFANNNHYPPLDFIIQVNIHKINHLFLRKNISIHLYYTNSL